MKAYIQVYKNGTIININNDDDQLIDRYEIKKGNLRLEVNKRSVVRFNKNSSVKLNKEVIHGNFGRN